METTLVAELRREFDRAVPTPGVAPFPTATPTATPTPAPTPTSTPVPPATTTTVVLTPTDDAYVRSGQPNKNTGSEDILNLNANRDGLARFDVSVVPSGSTVFTSTLSLVAISVGNTSTEKNYTVHRVLADWDEGSVTWNSPGSDADVHFTAAATDTTLITATSTYSWDVLTDVSAFVGGSATNYGWRVIWDSNNGGSNKQVTFGSKEQASALDRPVLTIVYVPP